MYAHVVAAVGAAREANKAPQEGEGIDEYFAVARLTPARAADSSAPGRWIHEASG